MNTKLSYHLISSPDRVVLSTLDQKNSKIEYKEYIIVKEYGDLQIFLDNTTLPYDEQFADNQFEYFHGYNKVYRIRRL